jgi:hypothetical protein
MNLPVTNYGSTSPLRNEPNTGRLPFGGPRRVVHLSVRKVIAWLAHLILDRIPMGYEDERGFHYGSVPLKNEGRLAVGNGHAHPAQMHALNSQGKI